MEKSTRTASSASDWDPFPDLLERTAQLNIRREGRGTRKSHFGNQVARLNLPSHPSPWYTFGGICFGGEKGKKERKRSREIERT